MTVRNARDLGTLMDAELAENFDADDALFDSRDKYVATHSLRAAAAGAAMPDVWVSRDGPVVSISWHDSMDGSTYFTLSRGERDIPASAFAEACIGFVTWVHSTLEQLADERTAGDRSLLARWLGAVRTPTAAIQGLLNELGLDEERFRAIADVDEVTDSTVGDYFELEPSWFQQGSLADPRDSAIAVAFRCTSPSLSNEELGSLHETLQSIGVNPLAMDLLNRLASRVQDPSARLRDYTQGYRLARSVRSALNATWGPLDIDKLLANLSVPVVDVDLADQSLDGGCVCSKRHGPIVFVNVKSKKASTPWGRRVVLAHELCHLLFDRKDAVSLGMVSGPWAPPRIERRANAFAIEFLLPLAGIIETVGPVWDSPEDEDVTKLMDTYEMGITAVTEHLRNMRRPENR